MAASITDAAFFVSVHVESVEKAAKSNKHSSANSTHTNETMNAIPAVNSVNLTAPYDVSFLQHASNKPLFPSTFRSIT